MLSVRESKVGKSQRHLIPASLHFFFKFDHSGFQHIFSAVQMRPSLVLISCLAGTSAFPVTHSIAPEAASTYKAIVASWVSAMSRPSNTFIGSSLSGLGPSRRRFKSKVQGKVKAVEESSREQLEVPTVQQPELCSPAAKHSGGQKKECNGPTQEAKHCGDSKDQVHQAVREDSGEQEGCSPSIQKSKGPGGGGFLDLPPAAEPIVDVGVNLCHKSFQKSLPDIIKRALHAKVTRMVSELLSSKTRPTCRLWVSCNIICMSKRNLGTTHVNQ